MKFVCDISIYNIYTLLIYANSFTVVEMNSRQNNQRQYKSAKFLKSFYVEWPVRAYDQSMYRIYVNHSSTETFDL